MEFHERGETGTRVKINFNMASEGVKDSNQQKSDDKKAVKEKKHRGIPEAGFLVNNEGSVLFLTLYYAF